MKATYWQRGETIDYMNNTGSSISAGTVVSLNTCVGIAGTDIGVGEKGTLHVMGVFYIPKDSAAIALGAKVYFNTSTDVVTATASGNVFVGWAVEAAEAGAAQALVKLSNPAV